MQKDQSLYKQLTHLQLLIKTACILTKYVLFLERYNSSSCLDCVHLIWVHSSKHDQLTGLPSIIINKPLELINVCMELNSDFTCFVGVGVG